MQKNLFQNRSLIFSCLFLFIAESLIAADMSKNVIAAFRGQLVISKDELPTGKTDKDTVAKIKSARLDSLTGESRENVTAWNFHYTAFLKSAGSGSLKLEFYTTDAKPVLAADKTLSGIDPKAEILSGEISINEDDGLKKGKTYTLNLTDAKHGVVATTKLTFK